MEEKKSLLFNPRWKLTPKIMSCLLKIELVKEKVISLPLTPTVLSSLRESARLYTTHYSTMIEGNRLELHQIDTILKNEGHFPGRERDEREVLGYYAALSQVEKWAAQRIPITENLILSLHALVMSDGKMDVAPTPYRNGQNMIRDGKTRSIVYLPPEAHDVPELMKNLLIWVKENNDLACPIVASIVHYQFATIHPYYDGNGRVARLLTTLILHAGGFGLKGIYSLEEYYTHNLMGYYNAISIGPSHNYYLGRATADITPWIEYFIEGMLVSFEKVLTQLQKTGEKNLPDRAAEMRILDPKQRKALQLFQKFSVITAAQIGKFFDFKPSTSAQLCKKWVSKGFLEIVNPSNKARSYRLGEGYKELV